MARTICWHLGVLKTGFSRRRHRRRFAGYILSYYCFSPGACRIFGPPMPSSLLCLILLSEIRVRDCYSCLERLGLFYSSPVRTLRTLCWRALLRVNVKWQFVGPWERPAHASSNNYWLKASCSGSLPELLA